MSFRLNLPTMELGSCYTVPLAYWSQDAMGDRIPIDLTGYEAQMAVVQSGKEIFRLGSETNDIIIQGNMITISLTASKTWAYPDFATASYDLLILPGGSAELATRLVYGVIKSVRCYTQPE